MGLFGKKSSNKIPAVDTGADSAPRQSPFGAGGPTPGPYGTPQTAPMYGQQARGGGPAGRSDQYQQQYGGPAQASSGYANGRNPYVGGPPQGQGQGQGQGYGGYGGYSQQPQQPRFPDAKPPAAGFGSGFDRMTGGSAYKQGNNVEDELEREYGSGTAARSGNNYGGGYDAVEQQSETRDEEEDEVEAVKQQLRFTKQESLSSTRNALRIARETEETATGTILKLGEQSDKIANTERHLDMSKAHTSRADDNAQEIVSLNRSIFRPNIQFNKKAKRDAEEARILNRHIEEREDREQVRAEALKSQVRADQALTGAGTGSGRFADRFGGGRFSGNKQQKPEDAQKSKLAQRSRYQFEATESDDELEGELEDNLDEIGQVSARLNQLGRAMGTEIDEQNTRIQRISEKANKLDTRVYGSTQKLERIK